MAVPEKEKTKVINNIEKCVEEHFGKRKMQTYAWLSKLIKHSHKKNWMLKNFRFSSLFELHNTQKTGKIYTIKKYAGAKSKERKINSSCVMFVMSCEALKSSLSVVLKQHRAMEKKTTHENILAEVSVFVDSFLNAILLFCLWFH